MRQIKKVAKISFELQQDESDCGVAALASIIQFHGGYIPLEKLRSLSGTTTSGTTMLGLLQAGQQTGLETDAFEGTIDELKKLSSPSLLHVLKHNTTEHYIVCYSFNGSGFLIGDPAEGVVEIDCKSLEQIWKSKALLTFLKTDRFVPKKKITKEKYRWIWASIVADQQIVISTLFIGLVISALGFSSAVFVEKLVDNVIPSKNPTTLVIALLSWLVLMLIKSGFDYLRQLILIKQSLGLNLRLTKDFLHKLIHLPKSFFDSRKKGDLIARLFDTGRVQASVGVIISQDIIDFLTLVVAVVFAFFYQSTIAFFLVLIVPFYFLIIYNYYSKNYDTNKKVMASYARNEAAYIDTLTGMESIKQLRKEASERDVLFNHFKTFQENVALVEKIVANFKISTDAFGLLSVFFVLTYCVTSVLNGTIQIGDMLAIFSISTIALSSTNRLAYAVTRFQEARAALDRTFDIISLSEETAKGFEIEECNVIKLENVSFGFPGHTLLFEDLNFSIRKNEITVLIGENGSGKSTILQIIQKFYAPQFGQLMFDLNNLEDISSHSLRKLLGVVPQQVKIFNQSLSYNISLSHEVSEDEMIQFCEHYGFTNFIQSFRDDLNTILGEEGINVSGGQKQLIALARALFNKPKFLLLDEFTSSMDTETENFALDLILKLKNEAGIFIITHNSRLKDIATIQYKLERGKLSSVRSPCINNQC